MKFHTDSRHPERVIWSVGLYAHASRFLPYFQHRKTHSFAMCPKGQIPSLPLEFYREVHQADIRQLNPTKQKSPTSQLSLIVFTVISISLHACSLVRFFCSDLSNRRPQSGHLLDQRRTNGRSFHFRNSCHPHLSMDDQQVSH